MRLDESRRREGRGGVEGESGRRLGERVCTVEEQVNHDPIPSWESDVWDSN